MKAYKGGKFSSDKSNIDPNLLKVIKMHEEAGRNIIANKSAKKYSAMLLDLVRPYAGNGPELEDLENFLEIGVIAWNIANMKKLFPGLYKTMLAETKNDFGGDKESVFYLEKMVKDKIKKYPEENMFIHSFTSEINADGKFYVTTTAMPLEAFLNETFEKEKEDSGDNYNFEEGYITRDSLIVKYKQPFLDWLKKTDGNTLFPLEVNECRIYLLEEKDTKADFDKWLKKNFDKIFTLELEGWYTDEKLWPSNRNYKMFQEWFEVGYNSMVYDLENFPVEKM